MEAMDGQSIFGERDRYWGLLVDGFENPPIYANAYQPPYYQTLFEDYGFKTYFEQYMYHRKISDDISEKYRERSERILKNKAIHLNILKKEKCLIMLKILEQCIIKRGKHTVILKECQLHRLVP